MKLRQLIRGRPTYRAGFRGTWPLRIGDLFNCGIDYRNRTILDVGCNMGILAYEIAKTQPKSIHGVDLDKDFIHVAKMVFCGVPVESRFERLDLTRPRDVARTLETTYDIVVFLAVYQHLYKANGHEVALAVTEDLISRCGEAFVLRTRPRFVPEIEKVANRHGLSLTFRGQPDGESQSVFHVFRRGEALPGKAPTAV